ncbi:unnamed protein product [Rotaria sp. Silwood2]|nr:unnamed protein product [Rotaria sp. Silwood2]CAF4520035.1 unnamed protein product [Rotaria sp. Silwood2]
MLYHRGQKSFNSIGKGNTTQKGTSLIQNANIRTLINNLTYNLVRLKQQPEHINDKIAFTFNNLSFSNLCQKTQELKDLLNIDEQLWKWIVQYLAIKLHHILINKDYFDKIKKQLSSPDSQVSFISPVIPMPQPSSSTVITISEPQFRLSDFKLSTFQSLSSMLQINSNVALFRYHLCVPRCK